MDLLARAKQMEREFEQKKASLRELEIKQAMTKEQFVRHKEDLAAKGMAFSTGAELQALHTAQEERLRTLIQSYDNLVAEAANPTQAAQMVAPPPTQVAQAVTPPPTQAAQHVQATQTVAPPPTQVAQPTQAVTPPPPTQVAQPVQAVTPPPTQAVTSQGVVSPMPTTAAPTTPIGSETVWDFDGII